MRRLVVVLAVVVLGAGCSHIPGLGKAQASPSASSSAVAALDSPIPTPAGFPTDVPVYPKAKLTAGASFTSAGEATWGMEWQTTDPAATVQAYYAKQLDEGDWTLKPTPVAGTAFAATFARKSNPRDTGTIAVNADAGVTVIALSLLSSG